MLNLHNRNIIVTGGGSGIGAACARFCSSQGAQVVIIDRDELAGRAVADEIGGSAYAVDISCEHAMGTFINERCPGAIDGLAHCAGVLQRALSPERLTLKEWDLVNRVDLRGSYIVAALVGAVMAKQGHGAIVLTASIAGMRSSPLHAYGPAKAAVIALVESLSAEWGRSGVRVNAVSPGFTKTPALERGVTHDTLTEEAMAEATALGRLLRPSEVASAVGFLLSDLATGITGINLPVDAGFLTMPSWAAYS